MYHNNPSIQGLSTVIDFESRLHPVNSKFELLLPFTLALSNSDLDLPPYLRRGTVQFWQISVSMNPTVQFWYNDHYCSSYIN